MDVLAGLVNRQKPSLPARAIALSMLVRAVRRRAVLHRAALRAAVRDRAGGRVLGRDEPAELAAPAAPTPAASDAVSVRAEATMRR